MGGYDGGETTGFMSPARDHIDAVIDLVEVLDLRRPSRYLVHVRGDDLRDRGIRNGDRLVVDAAKPPVPGSVVVVFAEGDAFLAEIAGDLFGQTVLRVGQQDRGFAEAEIWAVATALIRLSP